MFLTHLTRPHPLTGTFPSPSPEGEGSPLSLWERVRVREKQHVLLKNA